MKEHSKRSIELLPLDNLGEIIKESSVNVYYRTKNMSDPRLLYQRCKSDELKGYVALMAHFLPTFESQVPKET